LLPLVVAAMILLTACAPAARPSGESGAAAGGATPSGAPKLLTIALNREPATMQGFVSGGSSSSRGNTEADFVHSQLVVPDADDVLHPRLATEVPSFETNSWRINSDGSMDVTWKLRPGVIWQDGASFTSADMLFTLTVYKDADLPHPYAQLARFMEWGSAPDPTTFVVHWSTVDARAPQGLALSPLPRHLLEDLYLAGDKDAFANSPRFTDDFVGLGPWRLARWERGSHLELTRFDGYFEGRAPLDSIIIRYIPDPNAVLANLLAGSLDLIIPPSVDMDAALELKRQREGQGISVSIGPRPWFIYVEIQRRPDVARPREGFSNPLVRQAFSYGTNRQELNDVMTGGLSPVADSWLRPGLTLRRDVESAIPQYPFEPARAQQLLTQAGWVKGADGVLTHAQTGERFTGELWSNTKVLTMGEKQSSIVAQSWKALGADVGVHPIPAALDNDREYGVSYPMASITNTPEESFLPRMDSRAIASAANGFGGRNKMGYVNPRVDVLLDRFNVAVEPHEQAQVASELVRELMGDAAFIPLYWEAHPVIAVTGIKATTQPQNAGWDAFQWDKR
jgi:peptide/nickel transport system substrate-binding protein